MGNTITINLDPTKDGFVGKIEKVESSAGRYVIIGTNYDHKFISEEKFDSITDELARADRLGLLMVRDYMIYYDTDKLIQVDGCSYLIGSFLVVEVSKEYGRHAYVRLGNGDVEAIKEDLSDYFTGLIIDGERCDALYVD